MNGEVPNGMRIIMKGEGINTTIINCYTLTNDSEEKSKDTYYDQLQAELKSTPPHHEIIIVTSDLAP